MTGRGSPRDRGVFPTIDPLFKLFYLSIKNISAKWTLAVPNWPSALSYFTIEFADRMPDKHEPSISGSQLTQNSLHSQVGRESFGFFDDGFK